MATHARIELEPMTAVERKTIHLRLKEFDGVETGSEGTEPNRFVVILPLRLNDPRLERWLDDLLATPGMTAIRDREEAWRCWSRMRCAVWTSSRLRGAGRGRRLRRRLARDPARGGASRPSGDAARGERAEGALPGTGERPAFRT